MSENNNNAAGRLRRLDSRHARSSGISVVLIPLLFLASPIGTAYSQDAGNALDFDGIDDTVVVGKDLDPADQGTVEFWISADASDSRRVMGHHDAFEVRLDPAPAGNGYIVDHQFFIGGSDTLHATTILPFGEWHHIACTWDSDQSALIYIDGALDAASNQAGEDPGSFPFTIGTRTDQNQDYFDGRLDEVRIWSEVRTEQQIQEYMLKTITNAESEANLIAYWRFDEKNGTECTDHSGSGFDGKMTKMDPAIARIASTAPVSAAVLPAGRLSTTWGNIKM